MTDLIEVHGAQGCSQAKLLFDKAVAEDGVSVEEQRFVDAHTGECSQCRRLFALKAALPQLAPTAEPSDAAIAAVMADLRRHREASPGHGARWAAFAIAAAIAALTIVGVWILRGEPSSRSGPHSVAARCDAVSPVQPVSGVYVAHCRSNAPDVDVRDGEVNVVLRQGSVALFVDPSRSEKKNVTVETAMGTVRVKGTLFKVFVDDSTAWVQVFRGVVEVIPPGEDHTAFRVAAGHGAALGQGETFTLAEADSDTLIQALPVPTPGTQTDHRVERVIAQNAPATSTQQGKAESGPETDRVDNADLIERDILESIRPGGAPADSAATKRLIDEARTCLLNRDWSCAASRYQDVLRLNSRRSGMTTVLINLAKIELRHLNRPKRALSHYNHYLRQAPNGPLAQEALLGMADSYRRLGHPDREANTLRRFIRKYPNSKLTGTARERLEQLVD